MSINYQGDLFKGKPTEAIKEALEETREYAALAVRGRTPVDTGRLKSEWQFKLKGNGLSIENPTPYAIFVELGTSKMAPRAMLRRSLPGIQDTFQRALARNVGRKLAANLSVTKTDTGYDSLTGKQTNIIDRFKNILRGK